MAKTLKLTKAIQNIIKKMEGGKTLTEKQQETLNSFLTKNNLSMEELKELLLKAQSTEETSEEQKEETSEALTLENWETLTQEQKLTLKNSILKTKYGTGGENIGLFPTLLGAKTTNPFIIGEYGERVEATVRQNNLNNYKDNGSIKLLPLEIGDKTHYLLIILPNKPLNMDIWELYTEAKPYTKYTKYSKIGKITVNEGEYIISNIYSNKNKTWNNGKRLANLFRLFYNIKETESIKDLKPGNYYLKKDITENGKITYREYSTNSHKPTGKSFSSIGEYLQRKLPTEDLDLLTYL